MTRSVRDAAIMLQTIARCDPASMNDPVPDYIAALEEPKSLRIGIPREYFYEKLDGEIENAITVALSLIGKVTASIREIDLPAANDTLVLRAEAYAYHLEKIKATPQLYQPDTLRRIRSGAEIAASDYIQARREMEQYRRDIRRLFDSVDLLITPTAPVPPATLAELLADLDRLRSKEILMLRNTRPFNAFGLPTISIPCGFTKTGLPIGMQITGAPWAEGAVLRLAHAYEEQTEWHTRRPDLEA